MKSTQLAGPQTTLEPTNTSHEVALFPSHAIELHTLLGSLMGHAGRVPAGEPVMVTQVPTEFAALHAWHCPVQAELQHTPSTQYGFPSEVAGQVAEVAHFAPMGTVATTLTIAVTAVPLESASRTVSIPVEAPAVYRPAGETDAVAPEPLAESVQKYGVVPPKPMNCWVWPGDRVTVVGTMVSGLPARAGFASVTTHPSTPATAIPRDVPTRRRRVPM